MKKIYALLAGGMLMLATSLYAQSPRTVLFEEFTGENCGPCAFNNPYLERWSSLTSQDSFIHLAYQVPIPSAGPIYNIYKTDANARTAYYGVNYAPWGMHDGLAFTGWLPLTNQHLPINYFDALSIDSANTAAINTTPTSTAYSQRKAVSAPCSMTITHQFNATNDSVFAMAIVKTTQTFKSLAAGSLKFHFVLTEQELNYTNPPGTNGEIKFNNVMRKMYPTAAGTTMADSLWTGRADTFRVAAKIPSYVRDLSQIQFVAWVQDNSNKEIKQSGHGDLVVPVNLTDMLSDGDSTAFVTCTKNATVPVPFYVTIRNTGINNLTACKISLSVDGATPVITNWTGSISPGTTDQVVAGTASVSGGRHTSVIIISAPNGGVARSNAYDTTRGGFYVAGAGVAPPYTQNFEDTNIIYPANCITTQNTWYPAFLLRKGGTGSTTAVNSLGCLWHEVRSAYEETDYFTLPKVDLSTASSCVMKFDHAYQQTRSTVSGNFSTDSVELQYSTDCGSVWNKVWAKGGSRLATVPLIATNSSTFTGYAPASSADWKTNTVNLSNAVGYSDVWIRFYSITSRLGLPSDLFIDDINITQITGVEDVQNVTKVSLYPNPASSMVSLEMISSNTASTEITISNTLGQVVNTAFEGELTAGSHKLDFNIATLESGVYTMTINSGGSKSVKKFVVARQ
jgi:Secretion system C-terminal sorting domain